MSEAAPCRVGVRGTEESLGASIPGRGGQSVFAALALTIFSLQAACTVVHVTAPDGATRVHRVAGLAKITLDDSSGPVFAQGHGFGLTGSTFGWTLGFAQHELALPGSQCSAIFWVQSSTERAALQALADTLHGVCVVDSHREKKEADGS